MSEDDIKRMLRKQRCRQLGYVTVLQYIIGVAVAFIGYGQYKSGISFGLYVTGLGTIIGVLGFVEIFALYGNRHCQRFLERVGSRNDVIWNEGWYEELTPYQSLGVRSAVVRDAEVERAPGDIQ